MAAQASDQIDALDKIDLCDVPAVIKWDDGQPRGVGNSLSSTPVSLDIVIDPSTTTASFKLRIALLQRDSDEPVPLFLLIGSPQIQSLAACGPGQTTDGAASLDVDTACLRFQLSSPPTLIMPSDPLRLKDKSQLSTMRSVRFAARQTVLIVHIQADAVPAHRLRVLRETQYSQFQSSLRHTDIGRLHGGRGGQAISTDLDPVQTESAPPSYNDVPAPPPIAPVSYGMLRNFLVCVSDTS